MILMKMYKRLLLTYINKYNRLDLSALAEELRMTEWQIAEIVSSLKKNGFFTVNNQKYELSEKEKSGHFRYGMTGLFTIRKKSGKNRRNLYGIIYIFLKI